MQSFKKNNKEKVIEERISYIDGAKGIGIFLVILGHHLLDSQLIVNWINSFHMPLFFIISGYLSGNRNKAISFQSYVKKKFESLVYPYITFSLINLLWYLIFHIICKVSADMTMADVVIRIFTTYGYHALWFLPTMFWCSIAMYVGEKKRLFTPVGTCLLIIVGSVVSIILHNISFFNEKVWHLMNYFSRVILGVSFICIGKYLSLLMKYLDNIKEWVLLIGCSALSVTLFIFLPDTSFSFSRIGNPLIFYPTACAGSIAILLISKKTFFGKATFFQFLGKNSLIVLALHMDIPIQISWIIIGFSKLSLILPLRYTSIVAIVLELLTLCLLVLFINRFMKFLLYPTKRRQYV